MKSTSLAALVLSLTVSVSPLAMPHAVHAQDEAATQLGVIVVDGESQKTRSYKTARSSTATRSDTPVIKIPQAITTVTPQALKDKSANTLDDALSDVSGITQGNTIAGANDAIIRRGFGESRDGSILTDGLNTALPHSFNATTDYVEVLKGPASTLYGVLDPGGMVNVVTKKPEDTFSAETWSKFYAYGAGRYSKKAGFDVTGPAGDSGFSYRLIAEGENGDYWRNFGDKKNWLIAPSLKWERDGTEVDVSYTHNDYLTPYERGTVYDATRGTFLDISPRQRLDEEWSKIDGASDLFKASVKHELGGDWIASVNYAYSKDSFSADQTRATAYNSATGILTRRSDVRGYYDTTVHSLRADLTAAKTCSVSKTNSSSVQPFARKTSPAPPCSGAIRTTCSTSTTPSMAQFPPAPTIRDRCRRIPAHADPVGLCPGPRASDRPADCGCRPAPRALRHHRRVGSTENSDTNGNALTPNAGLVWEVRPDASLYANVARTFRPNSSINNPYGSLDPEEGISYEIGSKLDVTDWLSGTLAVFYAEKKNVAYSETVAGNTVYRTAGLVRSKGVELDLAGQLTDELQVIGSYGLTDAVVVEDSEYAGNDLANVARHTPPRCASPMTMARSSTVPARFASAVPSRASAAAREMPKTHSTCRVMAWSTSSPATPSSASIRSRSSSTSTTSSTRPITPRRSAATHSASPSASPSMRHFRLA